MAASQADVAQALQGAGVGVSNLQVKDIGGVTAVYGSVSSSADKQKAEGAIEARVGKIANHIEVQVPAGGAAAARTYTIQAGDTLSKIAKHFYGDASQFKKIQALIEAGIKKR